MTTPDFFSISLRSTGAKALLGLFAVMCAALLVPGSAEAQCLECVWHYSEYDDPMADCHYGFFGGNWCWHTNDFRDCDSGGDCEWLARLDFFEDGTAFRREGDDPLLRDNGGRHPRDREAVERTCDGVLLGTRVAARRPSSPDRGMADGRNILLTLEL